MVCYSIWLFRRPLFICSKRWVAHLRSTGPLSRERRHKNGKCTAGFFFCFIADVIAPVMEYVYDRHVVIYVVNYVTWSPEFAYWLMLNFVKAPGPCGGRGEMAMALARSPCLFSRSTSDAVLSSLYSLAVFGAAGHNRGGGCRSLSLGHKAGTWTAV